MEQILVFSAGGVVNMYRRRETIKRWHKAFIWALLAGVVKGAVAAGKFAGGAAVKGAGMLAKGAKTIGIAGVDTAWSAGEKVVGGIINPAEKAFEAFKEGGIKGGIKEVGKQLVDSTDIGKSIDLIKGAGDMISKGESSEITPNIDLGQIDINKQAPVETGYAIGPGGRPIQGGLEQGGTGSLTQRQAQLAQAAFEKSNSGNVPSSFNSAFLDSLVGKQPDLEGSGRMAYLGDTLADLIRTGVKLDTTKSASSEDKLDLMKKQQALLKGIQDPIDKAQAWDLGLLKAAKKEARDRLGGSAMSGISESQRKKYTTLSKEIYQEYRSNYPRGDQSMFNKIAGKENSIDDEENYAEFSF